MVNCHLGNIHKPPLAAYGKVRTGISNKKTPRFLPKSVSQMPQRIFHSCCTLLTDNLKCSQQLPLPQPYSNPSPLSLQEKSVNDSSCNYSERALG